jgi:hypothetical protein
MRPRLPAALLRAAALALFAAAPARAAAQEYLLAGTVSLSAGAADFDLNGTGHRRDGGAPRPTPSCGSGSSRRSGLSVLRPREAFASRLTYVVPEAMLQLQWPGRHAAPVRGSRRRLVLRDRAGPRPPERARRHRGRRAPVRLRGRALRPARRRARARIDREFSRRTTELTGGLAWRF